ncbi:MAG: DUF4019 domain-containing protein [Rhodanobacteraceae bacterium]
MFVRAFLCVLLLGVAGVAVAQNPPATAPQQPAARQQQLTPEQRAALQKQNQVLVKYADRIVAMIDNGQAGQVWDQASEVAKKTASRNQFVKSIQTDRSRLGTVKSRRVAAVYRSVSEGKSQLPAGEYVNVRYATEFSKQAKPVRELVSFHLDPDRKWRLSGYTLLKPDTAPRTETPSGK